MEIDALEAMKKEVAGKLFMEMEDWDAFKPEDEAEFDKVIGIINNCTHDNYHTINIW